MSTLKSSAEDLTLNADGGSSDVKFQINAVEKASISSAGKVALGGSTAVTVDSQVAIHGGNLELTTAGSRYWIARASDAALTGSLYSPSDSIVRLSGAGTSAGIIEFEPRSSNGVIARVTGDGLCFGSDTAAANALDDYEEGSWTPTYAPQGGSFTTLTLVGATPGRYVKIGKQVTCWWYLGTAGANITGATGDLYITGLPFASETVGAGNWGTGIYSTKWGGDEPTVALINSSESFIRLLYRASHNADLSELTKDDMGTGGDSNYTRGWVTYRTA